MMRRSLVAGGSYCQRLQHWTRCSARPGISAFHATDSPQGQICLQDVSLTQLQRRMCTVMEQKSNIETPLQVDKNITDDHGDVNITFRTDENDPTLHDIQHESLFYKLPNEEYQLYLHKGQWPRYQKQVKTFQESVLMVRKPALEVFNIIDNINLNYPPVRILFYGKNGAGKSMSLSHVAHRYAKRDWLLVHIPSMINILRYQPLHPREVAQSTYNEERVDYLEDASLWLQQFRAQNLQHLENLKASKDYTWSRREQSTEGTSLLEITDFGINRKKYASDCIGVILREVKRCASEKQVKVLVAVDGINGFWRDIRLRTENKKEINVQELSMFHHFRKMFEPTWSNGVCIGTVCAYVETLDTKLDVKSLPYTPQHLLKKEGFEFMDPFIPILVPEYSTKEIYNCIEYYIERKWIQKPRGLTEEGKKELIFLSNKNPLELMNICAHW